MILNPWHLTNMLAEEKAKARDLEKALDHAMAIINETAVHQALYGMSIHDEEHPWHEDVKAMRELTTKHNVHLHIEA